MKRVRIIFVISALAVSALTACQGSLETSAIVADTVAQVADVASSAVEVANDTGETPVAAEVETSAAAALAANAAANETVAEPVTDLAGTVAIALNGDSIAVDGDGVTVDGSTATITAAGIYTLSGALNDGQIIVDTGDETPVQLVLNGVDIRNSTSAPIALMNSAAAVIVLADNSANYLEDGASYAFLNPVEEEPSAAIFSNDDVTITGNGSLTVTGNYNDAIASDDGITIESGNITVTAADDGIRGKDYLAIEGGTLVVNAGGDGLKSDNEQDPALGYIAIEGGTIQVTAAGDAIAAGTNVLVTGGEFALASGGGSSGQIAADASAKGIKGLANVVIDGGTFAIDAADDAIHSNANITLNGGTFVLASGDDGIHADSTLTLNDGDIRITQSYEGIESALITINDGSINLTASDDGINVAGGMDGSGMMAGPGRGGRGGPGGAPASTGVGAFTYTGDYYLIINGGYIVVEAAGDGVDVNGAIEMTGGVVLVNGPTEQMNGALDYDATFNISGGYFLAAGSAGMAQSPGQSSAQNSLLVNFSGTLEAGTLIHIQDSAGNEIVTFSPSKAYQSLTISSPALVAGTTYTIYVGGRSTGTATDGLYEGGSYTPGTEYESFTVSSVVTTLGGGSFR